MKQLLECEHGSTSRVIEGAPAFSEFLRCARVCTETYIEVVLGYSSEVFQNAPSVI